jgi:UrcA family protein
MPTHPAIRIAGLFAGAALAAVGLMASRPAFSQTPTVEELVVTGQIPGAEKFTYPVSYADLDLKTVSGQAALRHRVRVSAEYVCRKLADRDNKPNTFGDCRRKAVNGGEAASAKAIAAAKTRTGPFHPGPTWDPPPTKK